jgi:hypothetical protein
VESCSLDVLYNAVPKCHWFGFCLYAIPLDLHPGRS